MRGSSNYRRAIDKLKQGREPARKQFKGLMGIYQNGERKVEVYGRTGFVWVRLRNSYNEIIQAYSTDVAPVFDLPVIVERDPSNQTRYRVVGRDVGRYSSWGNASAYLGTHGGSHSFSSAGGGDVVWVATQQIMYFMVQPSGTAGAMSVYVNGGAYYYSSAFKYAGGTGIAGLEAYKPTGSNQARMVLIYLSKDTGNLGVQGGQYFDATITGVAQFIGYTNPPPGGNDVPLAAVRLVTGTSSILWGNLTDVRPWLGLGSF